MSATLRPEYFFKYASARVAKLNLSTKSIRWNCPLNYNDPFDCYFSMGLNFELSAYRDIFLDRFVELILGDVEPRFHPENPYAAMFKLFRALRDAGTISKQEFKQEIGPALDEGIANFVRGIESERERWQQEVANLRLLCVCEEVNNLLVWSHYADEHRGVAFQFECIKELDVPLLVAKPVIYSSDAPSMAMLDEWIDSYLGLAPFLTGTELWHRLTHTKSKVWSEEKEWRVVTAARKGEQAGFEDTPFHPKEISKVFFGCRISKEDKNVILSLLSGQFSHVKAYQAIQHSRRYSLEFEQVS